MIKVQRWIDQHPMQTVWILVVAGFWSFLGVVLLVLSVVGYVIAGLS